MKSTTINENYLSPAEFVNSDSEEIIAFAKKAIGDAVLPVEKAVKLYYAVRDGFNYNPYTIDLSKEAMKASHMLTRDYGYCVEKACLLAAVARAVGRVNLPADRSEFTFSIT